MTRLCAAVKKKKKRSAMVWCDAEILFLLWSWLFSNNNKYVMSWSVVFHLNHTNLLKLIFSWFKIYIYTVYFNLLMNNATFLSINSNIQYCGLSVRLISYNPYHGFLYQVLGSGYVPIQIVYRWPIHIFLSYFVFWKSIANTHFDVIWWSLDRVW